MTAGRNGHRRRSIEFKSLPTALESSIDAEQAFLGSLLNRAGRDSRAIDDALTIVDSHHFHSERGRVTFEFFRRCHQDGRSVGAEFIAPVISEAEGVEWDPKSTHALGIADWLIRVMDLPGIATTPQEYGLAVVGQWRHREVINAMRLADEELASPLADNTEVVDVLRSRLDEIAASVSVDDDAKTHIGAIVQEPPGEDAEPITTFLAPLDKALRGGLRQKQLVVVGARPSVGKSALLGQIGGRVGKAEIPVLYLSFEMSKEEMRERWSCQENWPGYDELEYEMLLERPLWFRETGGWTIERVESEVRRAVSRNGVRLVVLDYLNLIQTAQHFRNPVEKISEITRRLKQLAMQQSVCVLTAAQFNRGAESRESERPRMSDFRESGSIEQDADVLIGLQRDNTPGASCSAGLFVMKQRGGPTADITDMEFDKERVVFREAVEAIANDFK